MILEEKGIYVLMVPTNCNDRLQLLDISVSMPANYRLVPEIP